MFYRFSEAARRTVFFARYEAGERGRRAIDTEHLLLGVVRSDPAGIRQLGKRAGFTEDALLKEIDAASPPLPKQADSSVDMPLSDDAKRALEVASAQGLFEVTPMHILLGLFRAPGVAASVLRKLGVTEALLRQEVACIPDRELDSECQRHRSPPIRCEIGSG